MWFLQELFIKRRSGNLPFKMRNITQSNQQECRESIKEEFGIITRKLPAINVRLKIKDFKTGMHDNYKDIFGKTQKMEYPIFTQDEIAKFMQNLNIYRAVFIVLVLFESILYSLIAPLFIRRQNLNDFAGIEFLFGFAIAVLFVAGLHLALKFIWDFFEAKHLIEINNYNLNLIKPFYVKLFVAIFISIIFIASNISIGYIRAIVLEPGSTASNSFLDKIHGPLLLFSIAITFIAASVMGILEKEISEKLIKYKVFLNWKRTQNERKKYNTQVKDMLQKCNEKKELLIEKYWGVTLDSQRVFEIEVDDDKKELYQELEDEISNKTINLSNLTDDTYQKYIRVANTKLELFRYSIDSDKAINNSIQEIHVVIADILNFEKHSSLSEMTNPSSAE